MIPSSLAVLESSQCGCSAEIHMPSAFAVGSLAFARQKLLDRDVRREVKDALNSATAWGLILLGSSAATLAAAFQAVTLSFPHI
jgi:hypothetical protein